MQVLAIFRKGDIHISEANKGVVRKFYRLLEAGDAGMASELFAAGFVSHSALEGQDAGIEGCKQVVAVVKKGMPDF